MDAKTAPPPSWIWGRFSGLGMLIAIIFLVTDQVLTPDIVAGEDVDG